MKRLAACCLIVVLVVFPGCRHVHNDASRERGVYHLVQRHQTFWRICKTYGADMDEVALVNGITDKTKIAAGQHLFIPRAAKVLPVDIYIEDVTALGRTIIASPDKNRFIWPVAGIVTDQFGKTEKRRHDGIDIAAPPGTPVMAADGGKVVYSDNTMKGYGNLIIIEHPDHCFTVYGHNEENLSKEEEPVKRGDIIARVGKTGNATGPHLHFEVRKGSIPLDPLQFLP
jgi:murein DD-endopeptidase MepM/ murein hydrolase activator NlpD